MVTYVSQSIVFPLSIKFEFTNKYPTHNSHTVSIHGFVLTSEESRSNFFKWASDIFEHSFSIWATACTTNCFFHGHVCCRPKMPVQMTLNFMCKRGMDESVKGARKKINSQGVSKIVPVQLS